jgi:hypothetical protein
MQVGVRRFRTPEPWNSGGPLKAKTRRRSVPRKTDLSRSGACTRWGTVVMGLAAYPSHGISRVTAPAKNGPPHFLALRQLPLTDQKF